MTITPMDVRNRQFGASLRGYDPAAVREYLDGVAVELERLARERLTLSEQLGEARDRVKQLTGRELQVQDVLRTAEKAATERVHTAEHRAQAIVARAEAEGEDLLARARREREALLDDVSELRAQRDRFRAELKATLRSHAEMLVRTASSDLDTEEAQEIAEAIAGGSPVDVALGSARRRDAEKVASIDEARRRQRPA